MNFFKKSLGFLLVLAIIPSAFAATSYNSSKTATARPSIMANIAGARMPSMIGGGLITNPGTGTGTNALLVDQECIEAYTECAKGGDVCGTGFEECTNKTLFFAKKAQCTSILMQCRTSGITALFGISNQTSFGNKNTAGDYIYPTDGSILGQLIEAGHINNRYTTSNCVKRYTTCVKKDDVCGADFELCTTYKEFKKQKLFCESTLARCQEDGIMELFGSKNTTADPSKSSRIGIMIEEGSALAAVNAVSTCYKVADQCILNACASNPYKCKEGSNNDIIKIVESITKDDDTLLTTTITRENLGAVNRSEISGFLKNACLDTIGTNKFCYATFIGNGAMPTDSQLKDQDNQDDIFAEAYSSRMSNSMKSKIDDLVVKFDTKMKKRCSDTIVNCAMRTCGGGSGAACYAAAFGSGLEKTVANAGVKSEVKTGCEAVVNHESSCKYSAASFDQATGIQSWFLSDDLTLFDILFTSSNPAMCEASDVCIAGGDPVGAVAALDAKLSTSYNAASLDNMKRQCQSIATGCVRSMCGDEFSNCYRNRTDVYSTLTQSSTSSIRGRTTSNTTFNDSMNKVGGVLDRTIVIGLCLNTVKNNATCEEHIKAEASRVMAGASTNDSWNSAANTRDGWLGSGEFTAQTSVESVQDVDENGDNLCYSGRGNTGDFGKCDDISGIYTQKKMISEYSYRIAQSERAVFNDLIYDLELEAQAQYNAKLTKQQNMCIGTNAGGILGSKDMGSTFMWAKLRSNAVPKSYIVNGLKANQFAASNELYGSFCRIRVTLQSDDRRIQEAIRAGTDWSTAYFAAGDSFTCGSWIPQKALEDISNAVGGEAKAKAKDGDGTTRGWMTALGAVVGIAGGGIGANAIQKGGLGGLLGSTNNTEQGKTNNSRCSSNVAAYTKETNGATAQMYATAAIEAANKIGKLENDNATFISQVKTVTDEAAANGTDTTNKASANTAMKALGELCSSELKNSTGSSSKATGNLIGAGVGGVAGGLLGYFATKSVQDASANKAEREAKEEWMNEVGNHIRCIIGADEVGMFSDIITTEM